MSSQSNNDVSPLLRLSVRLEGGPHREHAAITGLHLVELMRAHGLPVKAECGGAGVCATCHIRVPPPWRDMLAPPTEEELAKLDEIPEADEDSRLACQIVMTEALDGLEVELRTDSQIPPARSAA